MSTNICQVIWVKMFELTIHGSNIQDEIFINLVWVRGSNNSKSLLIHVTERMGKMKWRLREVDILNHFEDSKVVTLTPRSQPSHHTVSGHLCPPALSNSTCMSSALWSSKSSASTSSMKLTILCISLDSEEHTHK